MASLGGGISNSLDALDIDILMRMVVAAGADVVTTNTLTILYIDIYMAILWERELYRTSIHSSHVSCDWFMV